LQQINVAVMLIKTVSAGISRKVFTGPECTTKKALVIMMVMAHVFSGMSIAHKKRGGNTPPPFLID
jgi:hypothetical protein